MHIFWPCFTDHEFSSQNHGSAKAELDYSIASLILFLFLKEKIKIKKKKAHYCLEAAKLGQTQSCLPSGICGPLLNWRHSGRQNLAAT